MPTINEEFNQIVMDTTTSKEEKISELEDLLDRALRELPRGHRAIQQIQDKIRELK